MYFEINSNAVLFLSQNIISIFWFIISPQTFYVPSYLMFNLSLIWTSINYRFIYYISFIFATSYKLLPHSPPSSSIECNIPTQNKSMCQLLIRTFRLPHFLIHFIFFLSMLLAKRSKTRIFSYNTRQRIRNPAILSCYTTASLALCISILCTMVFTSVGKLKVKVFYAMHKSVTDFLLGHKRFL